MGLHGTPKGAASQHVNTLRARSRKALRRSGHAGHNPIVGNKSGWVGRGGGGGAFGGACNTVWPSGHEVNEMQRHVQNAWEMGMISAEGLVDKVT